MPWQRKAPAEALLPENSVALWPRHRWASRKHLRDLPLISLIERAKERLIRLSAVTRRFDRSSTSSCGGAKTIRFSPAKLGWERRRWSKVSPCELRAVMFLP